MNGIILVAGMGTRLRPLTYKVPKALVDINNEPMVERQIKFLNEIGVKNIILVTGYLHEKFEYLKHKYNVKIVFNDKYEIYNNIYSMYLVKDYLEDSYVIDGDTYISTNFFKKDLNKSTYFSGEKEDFVNEWVLDFDAKNKVYDIIIRSGKGYILSGVSYWSTKDAKFLSKKLDEAIQSRDFKNLYWDDMVKENLGFLDVKVQKILSDDWFEIDTLDDLNKLKLIKE